MVSMELVVLLFFVAMLAGAVDAMAGGGGLITIPTLLAVGLPPETAIATNKIGGIAGTCAATLYFMRSGKIDIRRSIKIVATVAIGAIIGGWTLTNSDSKLLLRVVPVLLVLFSIYFVMSPKVGASDSRERMTPTTYAATLGPIIGFYDGYFGPGTGSLFAFSLVALLGFNLIKATAHAKLLNLSSNLASALFFGVTGSIAWAYAAPMLIGQLIGSTIGARMAVAYGHRLIRVVLSTVAIAISVKLSWQG